MLTNIVRGVISSRPDFELVGEGLTGVAQAVRDVPADVVILGLPASTSANLLDVLYARPQSRIIAIDPKRRIGKVHELQPQVHPLGEILPLNLAAVIREQTGLARSGAGA